MSTKISKKFTKSSVVESNDKKSDEIDYAFIPPHLRNVKPKEKKKKE
jgi:hypothetical protein